MAGFRERLQVGLVEEERRVATVGSFVMHHARGQDASGLPADVALTDRVRHQNGAAKTTPTRRVVERDVHTVSVEPA
jgi:hypothetical protein